MINFLLEKIQQLRDHFVKNKSEEQYVQTIDSWMEEAKRLFLIQSLKDHDGIKYVLQIFEGEVRDINELLQSQYSKELPDSERDRLLDRKELAQKYLNLFIPVENSLEELEKVVDEEIART